MSKPQWTHARRIGPKHELPECIGCAKVIVHGARCLRFPGDPLDATTDRYACRTCGKIEEQSARALAEVAAG